MSMMYPSEEPEDQPEVPEELRESLDTLTERASEIEDKLRQLGLYVGDHNLVVLPGPEGLKPAMILDMTIGDVAWSDRVQNPENYSIEKEFAELAVRMADDTFLDQRERIRKNILAGRNPLDDGDDQ